MWQTHAALHNNGGMAKVRPFPKRRARRTFIREWRQHRGLTLEQLAERTDLTHGAISQLERGLINYTQPTLESIADALRCEPADLIMRPPNSAVWSIWDNVRDLPEPEQRQIAAVIEAMRKIN